jgi:hypothetical protein
LNSLFGPLSGGGWGFLAGVVAPVAIALGLFDLAVLPYVPWEVVDDFYGMTSGEQIALLGFIGILIALGLSALQTPLYSVLEGYLYWPKWLQDRRIEHHKDERQRFLDDHELPPEIKDLQQGILLVRSQRWPVMENQIAPTRLGNAIRSFEVYGWDRFCLDNQTLWYELEAVTPPSLLLQQERIRVPVDFCVNGLYLAAAYAVTSAAVGLTQGEANTLLLVAAGIAVGVAFGCYLLATSAARAWGYVVQAIINHGRLPLANSLGLRLPATLTSERQMWAAVTRLVRREAKDEDRLLLDGFRAVPPKPDPPPGSEAAQYVVRSKNGVQWFELGAGGGSVVASGPVRSSRDAVLEDVALLRSVAITAAIVDAEPSTDGDGS